jgi:peptidoglycan/LPS O-acetylase OafA/YrhL
VSNNRLLIFDIVRIIAIILVVLLHVGNTLKIPVLTAVYGFSGMNWQIGMWGIALFLVISGSVLEYSYGERIADTMKKFNYRDYVIRRIFRIYPAYWVSIIIALVVGFNHTAGLSITELMKTLSGFYPFITLAGVPFVGSYAGDINPVGWFICTIICLYFLYPMISQFLKNHGFCAMVIIILSTVFIRMVIPPGAQGYNWYWFPLSRIAEFAFGIYIIQIGWYPKMINSFQSIRFLSDLSFSVFLVHFPVLFLLTATTSLPWNILLYSVVMLVLAIVVYFSDYLIHQYLKKIPFEVLAPLR